MGNRTSSLKTLAVGGREQLVIISFDGVKLTVSHRYERRDFLPSWMILKEPNILYTINPLGDDTNVFRLSAANPDSSTRPLTFESGAKGSHGGVHLEFNADKTRIVEASFFSSQVDVWDVSAADGSLRLMRSLSVPGSPASGRKHHRPHQAVLDPTGRFFVIPNLTADRLLVLDAKDDAYEYTNLAPVPAGVGPRHVAFLRSGGETYLVMVAEFTNELFLFEARYAGDTIMFAQIQRQSTYESPPPSPSSAKATEIVVARNQRDVYVSNRRMDPEKTDDIAHFAFRQEAGGAPRLDYVSSVSTSGRQPRSFCLSDDPEQKFVFVANEQGAHGLVVLRRDEQTGVIDPEPAAALKMVELRAPGTRHTGLHFVCQIS
ncbi:putative isomerase YbhE [Hypoxylon sp. FL1284]|nr:putative isomerase YbhE [Hypoxylon sp. FL1284]